MQVFVLRGLIIIVNLLYYLNKDKLNKDMVETIFSWRAGATKALNESIKK